MSIGSILDTLTIVSAILGAIYCLIKHRTHPGGRILESMIQKTLTASTIPTGFFLCICAFNPSLLEHVKDLGIYLAAAGLALLFVSFREIFN